MSELDEIIEKCRNIFSVQQHFVENLGSIKYYTTEETIEQLDNICSDWRTSFKTERFIKCLNTLTIDEDQFNKIFNGLVLDDYSFLGHLSENVKKAIYHILCNNNGTIKCYRSNFYLKYLKNIDDLYEFYGFFTYIPKQLTSHSHIYEPYDESIFEDLFNTQFNNLYI